MRKFLIDTDAGIDDAVALMMALNAHYRKEIDIVGITCVQGNTSVDNVCINVLRTMDIAGCPEIPVFCGASETLVVPYTAKDTDEPQFNGIDGFNDVDFGPLPDVRRIQSEGAVDAIRRFVTQNPGDVTLVALGPLTNLALAFKIEPRIPALLKELHIMGGNVEARGNSSIASEFNFDADPEAAYIVLRKTACPTYIAPLELCEKYSTIPLEFRKDVLGKIDSKVADFLNRLEQPWFDQQTIPGRDKHWMAYDQLAMMVALDRNTIVTSRSLKATVELTGNLTRGQMVLETRPFAVNQAKSNVVIIDKLNEEVFKQYLVRTFKFE